MRDVAAFVGVELADSKIERIVANNTFEKMHAREARGEYVERYDWALSPGNADDPESYKVRRGKIGGYVDYRSAEDIAYCDEILHRHRYFEKLYELMLHRPPYARAAETARRSDKSA